MYGSGVPNCDGDQEALAGCSSTGGIIAVSEGVKRRNAGRLIVLHGDVVARVQPRCITMSRGLS